MTSVEALRALNAAESETQRQFNSYVSYAMMVGSQTEQAAKKRMWIISAAVIGGFSLLGLIFCIIGGWMILWGLLLIGLGILFGVLYINSTSDKIRKIQNDKNALEESINNNSNY